jgi:ribose transport system permease protein
MALYAWGRIRLHWMEGPVVAAAILVLLLLIYNHYSPAFNSYQLQVLCNDSTALALAAVGETLVVLTGGFDLSAGSVLALANVLLATKMTGANPHDTLIVLEVLGIGLVAGLANGFFVAFLRLQSIIVTIATMFIFTGLALVTLKEPGGQVPPDFTTLFTGTIGSSAIPNSLVVVLVVVALWPIFRRTKLGKAIFAVGSDAGAAFISGVRVRWVLLATYALAGLCYGAAGIFWSAQTGSGDPNIGDSFLLTVFIAVVIGGTRFGGGYGSAVGSVLGAFISTEIGNVLQVAGVNGFWTEIVEGVVLIAAVLLSTIALRLRPKRFNAGWSPRRVT